jgi:hypothetical protein
LGAPKVGTKGADGGGQLEEETKKKSTKKPKSPKKSGKKPKAPKPPAPPKLEKSKNEKKTEWNGHTVRKYVNAIPPNKKKSRILPDGTREILVTFKEKEEQEDKRRKRRDETRKKEGKSKPKNESLYESAANLIVKDILEKTKLKGD